MTDKKKTRVIFIFISFKKQKKNKEAGIQVYNEKGSGEN